MCPKNFNTSRDIFTHFDYEISGLNVKLENDESELSPIMTVKWKERVLKCDKREVHVQSSRWVYLAGCIPGGCVI